MLQADLGLFLLFYHKSRFAGVFILVFSAHLFASCGVVWYEKKRLPPFSGAALLKIQVKVPFDTVKFSREFIWEVLKDPTRQRFYKKLIDACHEMGVDVCAEGVETLEMYNALRELGVDMFQGYYFARPMPIEDAVIAVKQCDALRSKENL